MWLAREPILRGLGESLVNAETPVTADAALVLAGDSFGHRILKGAELKQQGFVPIVWVSGPAGMYGRTEDELAIDFAVSQGQPREWFRGTPHQGASTADEARVLIPLLREAGVRRLLLVTSDYHTRRAGRLFRAAAAEIAPGLTIRVIAAPDQEFHADRWWKSRQGRKYFFYEAVKTVTGWFGL